MIRAGSDGLSRGSGGRPGPLAANSSQSAKQTASRSAGSSGRTWCTTSTMDTPRWLVPWTSPATPDCSSAYFSSACRYCGLIVTRMTPARAAPSWSMTHSGRFTSQTATRSPGSNRASRAPATSSAIASSSA